MQSQRARIEPCFWAFFGPAMLLTGSRQLAYSPPVKWQILPVGSRCIYSCTQPASFPLKDEGFAMNGTDARSSARPGAWKRWIIGFFPALAVVAAAVVFRGASPPGEALAQAPIKSTAKGAAPATSRPAAGPAAGTPARPVAGPAAPPQVEAGYEEERPGWFRRNGGGLGNIISRALGGF